MLIIKDLTKEQAQYDSDLSLKTEGGGLPEKVGNGSPIS